MYRLLPLIALILNLTLAAAEKPATSALQPTPELAEARAKYLRQGYGMFIHFNMSTYTRADVTGEKIFKLEHEDASHRAAQFAPPQGTLDIASWAQVAVDAGMRYGVLTVKHHGGFCLWDSAHTDHDVGASPYKKDVVRQFIEVFRAKGLGVGLYYSPLDKRMQNKDILAYTTAQITELLTNYGPIDALWLDQYGWPKSIPRNELRELIHRLQPTCLFDTNGGADVSLGDVVNVERVGRLKSVPTPFDPLIDHFPRDKKPRGNGYEICETMRADGGWFYKSHGNDDLRPDDHLLSTLQRQLQDGGSYLLDATPDQSGRIPRQQVEQLLRIAPVAKALLAAQPPGLLKAPVK